MKSKVTLIFSFLFFLSSMVFAQQVPWYSYDQTYYKIPTSVDGIHRISAQTLASSGISIINLNPAAIRLFHRGKEVAIHVQGGEDGRFDSGDYIDFFGLRNDATLDRLLYSDFDSIPNPYFNTHTDTTAFFLSVVPGQVGKRMSQRAAPEANLPSANQYRSEKLQVFSEQYSLGQGYAFEFRLSKYDVGQGWVSSIITKGATRQLAFSSVGSVPTTGTAKLEIGLVGRSFNNHVTRILAGKTAGSQRVVGTITYQFFNYPSVELNLQMSDFNADGSIFIGIQSAGPDATDNVSVAYAKLTFLKNVGSGNFDSELFILPPGNQRIQLNSVSGNYLGLNLRNPENPERILFTAGNQSLAFRAAAASDTSRIWIQREEKVIPVLKMESLRFRNLLAQPANYIIVSHRALEKPSNQYPNPIKSYANHRASPIGGGFDTLVVRVEDLYNQFAFGEKSPLGIFEFLKAYYPVHKPTHLLLSGRSLAIYATGRLGGVTYFYRNNQAAFNFQDLIPPGGYPFSDNMYGLDLDPEYPNSPAIAIGRIPARNSQQLADYLDKAIEKDQLAISEPWQKELIHLSGGLSEFELERYFAWLNGFKSIAEGPYLGGNVKTYRKRSNSSVEVIDITGDLNEGKSLLTFFGHGAPTIIDIEIGFASDPTLNYQNRGKYPVMLFNGCDYGSAFGSAYTQSEDWVITPQKGAVSVLANSSIGVDVYLRRYSDSFYQSAFADSSLIYRTLGEVKMEAEKNYIQRYGLAPLSVSHMEQMINFGDPGIRMFPANKADYSLNVEEVSVTSFDDNDPLTVLLDSLKLSFVIRNIGRVDQDSIDFKIGRQLSNGTSIPFPVVKIPSISRSDTIVFSIPNTGLASAGENLFFIEVNSAKNVDELTFANNSITYSKFIPLSGPINLSPVDFGITSSSTLTLTAQTPVRTTTERTLILQLDSAASYTSPFRKEIRITTRGLAEWPVTLPSTTDSLTFYWRSRFQDVNPGETDAWTNSSFSYIPEGPNGWTQRTVPQLEKSQLTNLTYNEGEKSWNYLEQKLGFEVFTVGAAVDTLSFRNTQFYLNQIPQILDNVNNANSRLCPNGSLGLVAFDQKTLMPYLAIPIPGFDILDSRACGRVPQMIQSIQNAWIITPGQTILLDYVKNVKPGDYVVIFSVGNVNFEAWPDIAINRLKELGANETTLRSLKNGDPYILYGRKGMRSGEAIEIVGNKNVEVPANKQTLSFDTDLVGYFTSGTIITPLVGPASNWERFFQQVNARDWINEELTGFDILGVKENGEEVTLIPSVRDSEIDLSFIDANAYPYLRLKYDMADVNSTAPAQLDKWQVNYTGVPEGALILKSARDQVNLREGENGRLELQFKNVSRYNFLDSIQVNWTFANLGSKKVENFTKKFPSLKAGEAFDFTIEFNSIGKAGENQLTVFANPRIQQEQTFRNNQVDLGSYFLVEGDNSTSLLDVNFDGIYIMDGDIVSPNVMITALLKNDQTLLYKKDTLGMELFLKQNCESCQYSRVNFSNPNLTWTPASEENDFKVSLIPGPLEDGMYTLRVTNEDSLEPYEIKFEVINESQITNFYPYPNPFSTSVRFVFTVTGMEVPDEIKIQIMTVTGKVVREILQNELGPIRIGNNLTEYAWDGRDEFGDQLANGVYIYRVLIRKNGQFMEHRPTAGDKAFKKGYGKMYLLR